MMLLIWRRVTEWGIVLCTGGDDEMGDKPYVVKSHDIHLDSDYRDWITGDKTVSAWFRNSVPSCVRICTMEASCADYPEM